MEVSGPPVGAIARSASLLCPPVSSSSLVLRTRMPDMAPPGALGSMGVFDPTGAGRYTGFVHQLNPLPP
jgi:hypothetical protein